MTKGEQDERYSRERRRGLSPEELDYIVERIVAIAGDRISEVAATKTVDRLYVAIGKGVLRRFTYFLGAAILAIIVFLVKNHIEIK